MVYDENIDYEAIGKRIKILRIKQNISQEKLAEIANLSVQYLSNVENAHSKASLGTFVKIANALKVSIDELLCDSIIKCRPEMKKDIADVIEDCSDHEIRVLAKALTGMKKAIRIKNIHENRQ